ncbi:MAG: 2'-5' RNA ligase family protein [Treponemataceae bacterium]|nr:2'-5' RNA ligase family protein [Treponemataceae bacterium]
MRTFKKNNFPQQTHFLGVLPPDYIRLTLEDCRRYMKQNYGCKSGYGTPIHVTLVPPFHLSEEYSTADLVAAIEKELLPQSRKLRFDAHIDNFDAFGDRTIFAKVLKDDRWTSLRDKVLAAVLSAAPGCTKKDKRPFQPHLTVANRDIPAGVSSTALEVMNELKLVEDFPVDNVTIFERQGGRWIAAWTGELQEEA